MSLNTAGGVHPSFTPPVLSSRVHSGTEAHRDGRRGPPAAAAGPGGEGKPARPAPRAAGCWSQCPAAPDQELHLVRRCSHAHLHEIWCRQRDRSIWDIKSAVGALVIKLSLCSVQVLNHDAELFQVSNQTCRQSVFTHVQQLLALVEYCHEELFQALHSIYNVNCYNI